MNLRVLDTDHLSLILRGHPQAYPRFALAPPDSVAIAVITAEEQLRGRLAQIRKAKTDDALIQAQRLLRKAIYDLAKLNILEFDSASAAFFKDMKRQHARIGSQDLRIAAIALANNATVITRNRADFG